MHTAQPKTQFDDYIKIVIFLGERILHPKFDVYKPPCFSNYQLLARNFDTNSTLT